VHNPVVQKLDATTSSASASLRIIRAAPACVTNWRKKIFRGETFLLSLVCDGQGVPLVIQLVTIQQERSAQTLGCRCEVELLTNELYLALAQAQATQPDQILQLRTLSTLGR
jgi:hypothetical protein